MIHYCGNPFHDSAALAVAVLTDPSWSNGLRFALAIVTRWVRRRRIGQ